MKSLLFLTLFVFAFSFSRAQSSDCKFIRDAKFYSYSLWDDNNYICIRQGDVQKEINRSTGDTGLYQVSWNNDCSYTATYISGDKEMDEYVKKYKSTGKLVVKIYAVTPEYYVYGQTDASRRSVGESKDTFWLKDQPQRLAPKVVVDAVPNKGLASWGAYLSKKIQARQKEYEYLRKPVSINIRFIVDTDGSITNAEALEKTDRNLAAIAMDEIESAPKWTPCTINGRPVKTYHTQPFTFMGPETKQ